MRQSLCVLLAVSALGLRADGQSVHIDISLDIETESGEPTDPDTFHRFSTQDRTSTSGPRVGALPEYQIDLGYEYHQGSLSESGKYVNFYNIPYAAPPIGELRWYRPNPPEYTEVVNNGSKNNICPQYQVGWFAAAAEFANDTLLDPVLDEKWKQEITVDDYEKWKPREALDPRSSEDCLLLDVVVPLKVWELRNARNFKPAVLVWIHGGGFIFGHKGQHGSPEGLLKAVSAGEEEFIYVAMNYRLGAFGFLAGDKFSRDGGTANAGLWDQAAALKWVKDYIYYFGGNPDRITVMGQSAGASSIMHHLTSFGGPSSPFQQPPSFKAAIIQSPGFFPQPNDTVNDETYKQFLTLSNATDLEALVEVNTSTLMKVNADMTYNSSYGLFRFGPTVDGYFVPDLPSKLLKDGKFHREIALMVGYEKFDGLVFTPPWIRTNSALENHVRTLFPGVSQTVLAEITKRYPIGGDSQKARLLVVSDFLDDIAVQCNAHYLSEAFIKAEQRRLYRFAFNIVPALHGHDVGYTFYPSVSMKPNASEKVATWWQSSLANFTRYWDPNDIDSTFWPVYEVSNRTVMNLGWREQWLLPNNTVGPNNDLLDRTLCDYWQSAPYYVKPKASLVDQTELYKKEI